MRVATQGFKNKIGEGGFGCVYKVGWLVDFFLINEFIHSFLFGDIYYIYIDWSGSGSTVFNLCVGAADR